MDGRGSWSRRKGLAWCFYPVLAELCGDFGGVLLGRVGEGVVVVIPSEGGWFV